MFYNIDIRYKWLETQVPILMKNTPVILHKVWISNDKMDRKPIEKYDNKIH